MEDRYKDVFVVCECHLIFSDRADLIVIKEELENEDSVDQHKGDQNRRIGHLGLPEENSRN